MSIWVGGVSAECIEQGYGWWTVEDTRQEAIDAAKRHRRSNPGHVVIAGEPEPDGDQ